MDEVVSMGQFTLPIQYPKWLQIFGFLMHMKSCWTQDTLKFNHSALEMTRYHSDKEDSFIH